MRGCEMTAPFQKPYVKYLYVTKNLTKYKTVVYCALRGWGREGMERTEEWQ
jgi:hypothetical protein